VVARPDLGGLCECQALKESQSYAGQIHMTFDRLHGATDFAEVGPAELRDNKDFEIEPTRRGHDPKMVSKNELRRTSVLGFLMEQFEPGYLERLFTDFDGIAYEKQGSNEFGYGERAHGDGHPGSQKRGSSCQDVVRKNRFIYPEL
jgi:hypothetical protein